MAKPPSSKLRPSRGKSGKPLPPPRETSSATPGLSEAPARYIAGPSSLPALRSVAFRPEDQSITAGLTALLTRPEERDEKAKALLARQPLIANHPIVAGTTPEFIPHRPLRPDKSEIVGQAQTCSCTPLLLK
jgi:excinuclease ABC subunit B